MLYLMTQWMHRLVVGVYWALAQACVAALFLCWDLLVGRAGFRWRKCGRR